MLEFRQNKCLVDFSVAVISIVSEFSRSIDPVVSSSLCREGTEAQRG